MPASSKRLPLLAALLAGVGVVFFVLLREERPGPTDAPSAGNPPSTSAPSRRSESGMILPPVERPGDGPAHEPRPLVSSGAADGTARDSRPEQPTRRVSGSVRRLSDDSPLVGVRVLAKPAAGDGLECRTGESPPGGFQFEALPLDVEELSLVSVGPWPERRIEWPLEPGGHDLLDLVVPFDSGFDVSGLVTDEYDVPLAGALVDVERRGEQAADGGGRFVVRDIAPPGGTDSVEVGARAPWYQRVAEPVLVPHHLGEVPVVHIRLQGSGALEGRVSDADGAPVAAARVRVAYTMTASHGEQSPAGLEATSDAAGDYRIDHVPPGRFVVVAEPGAASTAEAAGADSPVESGAGLVPVWVQDVPVDVGRETRLDLLLPRGARLSGRVTDESGAPLAGAKVLLETSLRWPAPELNGSSTTSSDDLRIASRGSDGQGETVLTRRERDTTTDAHGGWVFEHVFHGEKRVTASDPDGLRIKARATLEVRNDLPQTLDLLLPTGLTMRSRIVDGSGAPLEDVSVQVRPEEADGSEFEGSARTDRDGLFVLSGLAPVTLRLLAYKPGYLTVYEQVDPAAPEAQYTMQRAPNVRGRVLDAQRDTPLTSYTLIIEANGSTWSSTSNWEDGRFEQDVDDDEPVKVTVEAPGYRVESREGVVPAETAVRPLEFRLVPEP